MKKLKVSVEIICKQDENRKLINNNNKQTNNKQNSFVGWF
jgi:hypothetical protein